MSDLTDRALALQAAGRLQEAKLIWETVIDTDPADFHSLTALARLCLAEGDLDATLRYATASLALGPDYPPTHYFYGVALTGIGRFDESLVSLEEAIELRPDYGEAYHSRGLALRFLGRHREAIDSYKAAIGLVPEDASAHNGLANAYRAIELLEDAILSYGRAINLKPDYAEAYYNRAVAHSMVGRDREAVADYHDVIRIRPTHLNALKGLGALYYKMGIFGEALAAYDQAIARSEVFDEAHVGRGLALYGLGRLEEALESLDHALGYRPNDLDLRINRAAVLADLGRLEEALINYEAISLAKPDDAYVHSNRGVVLADLNRWDAAKAAHLRAVEKNPSSPEVRFNQALYQLKLGEFESGLENYEYRLQAGQEAAAARTFNQPRWEGGRLPLGNTILLHCEQGLGDTLQFCRYIPMVANLGVRVLIDVQPSLHRLLSRASWFPLVEVFQDVATHFDLHCPLMSLPLAFGTRLNTIPGSVPYLRADTRDIAVWKARLFPLTGLRVGLAWAGGSELRLDRRRSMPLSAMAPLFDVQNVSFISIQKGPPSLEVANALRGVVIHDFTESLHDFADTAALVDALDLVISVDTAVAHLAGALGKPVWLLNRFDTDWRWLTDRVDSPWYPTLRLFRQSTPGDWSDPIRRVASELAGRGSGTALARSSGRP